MGRRPPRAAARRRDEVLRLFGPDGGPLPAVWVSTLRPDLAQPVRGVWVDASGTVGPQQAPATDGTDTTALRSVASPTGGLVLCPWNLAAPLGAAFGAQPGACADADLAPVRLSGG